MSSASQDNRASATVSLMHAASEGDVQKMKALLAGVVDVNAPNQGGQTALMLAALMGHSEIVTLLLAAGADPGSRDRLGLTALDWSQRRGFPEVTQLLAGVSPPLIQPKPKSTSDLTDEKTTTESRTAVAREFHTKDLGPASDSAQKTFQTEQRAEAKAEAAEPPAQAAKPEPEVGGTSSESPHVSNVPIAGPPPSGTAAVGTEAPIELPILEISTEPQPQPTAKAPDPTPKSSEVSTSSERPHEREVAAESGPRVLETASVETEEPILEIRPEPQSQPAVQQPLDVLPATSITLPQEQEPQDSIPEIISAATTKPFEEPRQAEEEETVTRATGPEFTPDTPSPETGSAVAETPESPGMRAARLAATPRPIEELRQDKEDETLKPASDPRLTLEAPSPATESAVAETSESPRMRAARLAATPRPIEEPRQDQEDETLKRASDLRLTPEAPSPAAGSAVAETFASESPRMRAARLAATTERPPAFETSTLGISPRPTISDSVDVGELKRCPKCKTSYPDAQFSYCPHDYAKLITEAELQPVPEPSPAATPITVWLLIAFVLGSSAFAAYKLTAYLWQTEPPRPVAAKPAEQPPPEIEKPTFRVSGALAGLEVSIPEPEYPAALQSAGVGGPITVRIRVNKNGRVISATSSNGDRRLRTAAVKAATRATFSPEKLAEVSQRSRVVSGSITYEFAPKTTSPAAPSNPTSSPTSSGVDSGATSSNEPGAATPADPNSPVVGDALANAALTVPAAEYPSRAKRAGIGGTITVTVRVNRAGKVISWRSSSGDSQLRAAAIRAARKATFSREKLPGTDNVLGDITYNFRP